MNDISVPASESKDATFVFGACELDRASARIRRDGRVVPMAPKAYDVLLYLVQHAGRLVTKNELFEAVWPGVFVGDAALKVCIREIRKALEDDAHEPQYIETAHRRGYRFIAPLSIKALAPSGSVRSTDREHDSYSPWPRVERRGNDYSRSHAATMSPAAVEEYAIPETHYARSGDVNIAYQVVGNGPLDLVFVMGWVSHLDCIWKEPSFGQFLTRLSKFCRLIIFDKRGTGLSDRVTPLPTLEQRMDDVRAVMDAAGSRRAALLGVSEGGPMCSLFATTYPEKTLALIMFGSYAKRLWAPDYPWAPDRESRERFFEEIRTSWGGPVGIETRAPSRAADPAFRAWWSNYLRQGASPGAALTLTQMNAEIDVRDVLPSVRVPTLVLHRTGDKCLVVEEGRYVASLIPGAHFVELPGDDHLPFVGDQSAVVDEIATFLTSPSQQPTEDRVLATVLCAQMERKVSSAETDAAAFESHVHQEVAWFRGRGLTATPWGFFAAFDGPARAIACARALASASPRFGYVGHFGLHTGECDVTREGRVAGLAFDRAYGVSRVASAGEVLVSRTVTDLVAGSGVAFVERGTHPLNADGDASPLFAAVAGPGAALPLIKTTDVRSSTASIPPPALAAQPRRPEVRRQGSTAAR